MDTFRRLMVLPAACLLLMGINEARAADSLNVRTVGAWNYGPCRAAAGGWIHGHRYAVISSGTRLAVLNIDVPQQPRLTGDLSLEAEITRVWVGGDQAYAAVDGIGLALVDIADPARPVLRGSIRTAGTVTGARRFGTHLAVAAGAAGLLVADIADPGNPRLAGQCALAGPAMDVAVDAGNAYVAAGAAGLRRVDILDPTNPVETGHCPLEGFALSVELQGRHAYVSCGGGGLAIASIDSLALTVRCPINRPLAQARLYRDFAVGTDDGGGIRIVEFQDLSDIGQTGCYQLPYAACQLSVLDSLALVADSMYGLRIFDLSSLRHLTVADAWQGADTAFAVSTDDSTNYAYLAAGFDGLRIFSLDDPRNPLEIGKFQTGSRIYHMARLTVDTFKTWSDSLMCVAAGDSGLALLDLADPAAPRECARSFNAAPVFDVSMAYYTILLPDTIVSNHDSDSIYVDTIRIVAAACGDSNVWFYQITKSLNLQPMGPVIRNHPVYNIIASRENYQYNSSCVFCCSGGNALYDFCGIRPYDTLMMFRSWSTGVTGGWVRHNAARLNGITPVGDTMAFFDSYMMTRSKNVILPGAVEGGMRTDWYYGVCDGLQGFHYFSGDDYGLAHYATTGQCRDMAVIGDVALVVDGTAGLKTADLGRLNTIPELGSQRMALSSCALAVAGMRTYLATPDSGLWSLDWADSSRPRSRGFVKLPQTAFGLAVADSLLLAADGNSGLQILSLADPDSLRLVAALGLPGFALAVESWRTMAFVADDSAGLAIVDLGDPVAPSLLGRYDSPGTAFGVAIDTVGQRAVLADGDAGIQIVDFSDPAAPALAGTFNTSGCAFDIVIAAGRAYVADGGYGLAVLDISDPVRPAQIGGLITGGYARDLALRDSIVFLADGPGGLSVINVVDPARPVEVGRYDLGRQVWSVHPYHGCVFAADDAAAVRLLWPYWIARQPYVPPASVLRFENRPNPFRDQTVIQFQLGRDQRVTLSVYNIQGQLVRTLMSGPHPAGGHRVIWDGKGGYGQRLANGVYLCQLRTEDNTVCHKVLMLR